MGDPPVSGVAWDCCQHPVPSLDLDTIHLFFLHKDEAAKVWLDPCHAWLDEEERRRLEGFRLEQHRREFLSAKALVKFVLSRYLGIEPATLRFQRDEYGKPFLEHAGEICFNLSHANGTSVLVVGLDARLGVDIEHVCAARASEEVASRYFAPEECVYLRKLSPPDFAEGFFHIWTLKESFVKADGRGLSLPLSEFAFDLHDRRIVLRLPRCRQIAAYEWSSGLFGLRDSYICAWTRGTKTPRALTVGYYELTSGFRCTPAHVKHVAGSEPNAHCQLYSEGKNRG